MSKESSSLVTLTEICRALNEVQRDRVQRAIDRIGADPVTVIGRARVWPRTVIEDVWREIDRSSGHQSPLVERRALELGGAS